MMEPIDFKEVIKSKRDAIFGIAMATIILLLYKLYKYIVKVLVLKDQFSEDNVLLQLAYTPYRAFASIFGFYLCMKVYKKLRSYTKKENLIFYSFHSVFLAALFLIYFITSKDMLIDPGLLFESGINLFVGFFEEYMFRGLIFGSLCFIFGFRVSIVTTSVFFALWHMDVSADPFYMVSLFIASFLFCYAYKVGFSLVSLAIFHWLYDVIVFGFNWVGESPLISVYTTTLCLVGLIALMFLSKASQESQQLPQQSA